MQRCAARICGRAMQQMGVPRRGLSAISTPNGFFPGFSVAKDGVGVQVHFFPQSSSQSNYSVFVLRSKISSKNSDKLRYKRLLGKHDSRY
jgi:hypothetical protein